MSSVFKYPLCSMESLADLGDTVKLHIPQGGDVLDVQVQRGLPCIWAHVDPGLPPEERTFHVFGTGHPIPDDLNLEYIGTVQLRDGSLVLHVYEAVRV